MEARVPTNIIDATLDWLEHCIRIRPHLYRCWSCQRKFWSLGRLQRPPYCSDQCRDAEEMDPTWQCLCGHIQSDGLHCDVCGAQPPWGCDCRICAGTLPHFKV